MNLKKVHLIGIGGAGMSGLACILQDRGFLVQGSDIADSPKIEMLRKRGIKTYIGHRESNLSDDVSLVCYSSAVGPDNSELSGAAKKGVEIIKRGKLLASLCQGTKIIAVAGSHGKTTVVSLLSYLFRKAGLSPTVFIGGLPVDGSLSAAWGQGFSIIETDESDGTFLDYQPYLSVITNIDKEHLNYYKNLANLRKSFLSFAQSTEAKVFGCADDLKVKQIIDKVGGFSFGLNSGSGLRAKNIKLSGNFSYFDLFKNRKFCFPVKVPLAGIHNCLNVLAALSVIDYLEIGLEEAKKNLVGFKGTKRRFQLKADCFGVTFIDDYAHHPTEIKAALEAATSLGKRLLVVLQPHRPSRVEALFKEFSGCLERADLAVVTDIYSASESCQGSLSGLELAKAMRGKYLQRALYIKKEELALKIPGMIREGDVVIGLGAGDINKEMSKIVYAFKKNRRQRKY